MNQKRALTFLKLGTLVLLCVGLSTVWAGPTPGPQILFLHFKIKNNTVTLVDKKIRPGVLKHSREGAADEMQYELLSESGESLWKASIPDPLARTVEFEDPPGSGKMAATNLVLAEAEFTVRLPVVSRSHHVDFYKMEASAPDARAGKQFVKKAVGSVVLP